jgi:hypothetical protein
VDFVWVGDADDPDDALKIANFDIREDPSAFQESVAVVFDGQPKELGATDALPPAPRPKQP